MASKKPKLKVISLGGLQEIGKNITVFEYDNDIIIVDCGLAFPEDDMLGIDLVIPDISYLIKNMDKIRGAETREDMLLKNPSLYVTPIVRNGKEATVGNAPEVWKSWE